MVILRLVNKNRKGIGPLRGRLVLRFHDRDKELLKIIKNTLNVGNIDTKKSKLSPSGTMVRLIISKRDMVNVLLPLINLYNLQFLTFNRVAQYNLFLHIVNNNIVHWERAEFPKKQTVDNYLPILDNNLIGFDWFPNWVVGFTVAEGSFSFKNDGSAFYSIRQGG